MSTNRVRTSEKQSILIVDDDIDFAEGFSEILESRGYRVAQANSISAAQAQLEDEEIGLALLDIRLGRQSGLDLLSYIRENYSEIPCIMMTAYSAEDVAVQALKEGAYDYLRKPISPQELLTTLDRCFQNVLLQREKAAAEAALRASEERLKAVLNALPGIFLLLDETGVFEEVWCSETELLFAPKSEIVGKNVAEMFSKDEAERFIRVVLKTLETGETQQIEYFLNVIKGECWFDARCTRLYLPDGRRKVLILVFDVTEKKRFEAEAMRNSQLSSLGELASGVAHEINNPITGIINYSQILCDQTPETSDEHDIARRINREGERIAAIVKNLLTFGREAPKEYTTVHVQQLVDDCFSLAKQQLRQDAIKIEINIPNDLPLVLVNVNEMQQVLVNLLNNARYALNRKYLGFHPEKKLSITAEKYMENSRKMIRIVCKDNGIGIPQNILDKIMQPFYTTKPPGEGTGLGLSISFNIIKTHGGVLRFESVEGQFTRAIIELPVI
ncbi:MAG: response regulator [Calditrichaeota bacterium]|nr:response regulator [Calditrichota bacterium]